MGDNQSKNQDGRSVADEAAKPADGLATQSNSNHTIVVMTDQCPNTNGTKHVVTINNNDLRFQIHNQVGEIHENHLRYNDSNMSYSKIHVVDAQVVGSKLDLIFGWRTGDAEDIRITKGDRISGIEDTVNKQTLYSLPVPALGSPAKDWTFDGGSPGFNLRIKVKRR